MKRGRENGGARTALQGEGILVLGQYNSHVAIAKALGVTVPVHGDSVPVRVRPADQPGPGVAEIGGRLWRVAEPGDPVIPAPKLPRV